MTRAFLSENILNISWIVWGICNFVTRWAYLLILRMSALILFNSKTALVNSFFHSSCHNKNGSPRAQISSANKGFSVPCCAFLSVQSHLLKTIKTKDCHRVDRNSTRRPVVVFQPLPKTEGEESSFHCTFYYYDYDEILCTRQSECSNVLSKTQDEYV